MIESITINNRQIGVCEYGDKKGFPVFYFHGFPGSRLDGNLFEFDKIANSLNIRIIALDRPGIGLSDFFKKRKLLDWPKTLSSVAEKLNIKAFSVLGISGGGPYALACAYAIPELIHSVSIVSSMGPYNYIETKKDLALFVPKLIKPLRFLIAWGMQRGAIKNPEKLVEKICNTLPEVDLKYLNRQNRTDELLNGFKECFKQGLHGYLKEADIYKNAWGFKISDISSKVHIWHGSQDKNVSHAFANKISSEIRNCKTNIIENEGHFSLTGKYLKNILKELV